MTSAGAPGESLVSLPADPQSIVVPISPDPASTTRTKRSASGSLMKVAVANAPGRLSVQLVPFATVTD